jgi:hypothetical protein
MEESFITFKLAILAKKKGFNEYCRKEYVETLEHTIEMGRGGDCNFPYQAPRLLNSGNFDEWDIVHCKAPTQSVMQRWLRETHGLHISITLNQFGYGYMYSIIDIKQANCIKYLTGGVNNEFKTYELALEDGLLESLKLK